VAARYARVPLPSAGAWDATHSTDFVENQRLHLIRYIVWSCVCPFVRPSVRLLQVSVILTRLNLGLREQRQTIVQVLWFSDAKDLG